VRAKLDGRQLAPRAAFPRGEASTRRPDALSSSQDIPLASSDIFIDDFTSLMDDAWDVGDHNVELEVVLGNGEPVSRAGAPFRTSYSQYGQDIWVYETIFQQTSTVRFRMCGEKGPVDRPLFFLEVGAFHGFDISNTALLESKGWHGISIDPFPDLPSFQARAARGFPGRHILLPAAVGPTRLNSTFCTPARRRAAGAGSGRLLAAYDGLAHSHPGGGLAEFLGGGAEDEGEGAVCRGGFEPVSVTTSTLLEILARCALRWWCWCWQAG
jgi:hypothetical protein